MEWTQKSAHVGVTDRGQGHQGIFSMTGWSWSTTKPTEVGVSNIHMEAASRGLTLALASVLGASVTALLTHRWGKWNCGSSQQANSLLRVSSEAQTLSVRASTGGRGQSGSILTGLTGLWWCSTHTRGGATLYTLTLLWWNHLSSSVGWDQPSLHSPSPSSPATHRSLLNKYEW